MGTWYRFTSASNGIKLQGFIENIILDVVVGDHLESTRLRGNKHEIKYIKMTNVHSA